MLEVYPIGRATYPESLDVARIKGAIDSIAKLPSALRASVAGCTDLDQPIREGIWSIRAVVNHLADSHMNAFIRTKLALTEDTPIVKPYDPVAWSKLGDAMQSIEPSLDLMTALHARWVPLLGALTPAEWQRPWLAPSSPDRQPTWRLPLTYAWHGDHHVAQIRQARDHFGV